VALLRDRAGVGLLIKQLKGDYALGSIPPATSSPTRPPAICSCSPAYNLVIWFKRLCLPAEFQTATRQTLRQRILLTPAQLRRARNRPTLALPASGYQEAAWKSRSPRSNELQA
jgi:hypothetical protein